LSLPNGGRLEALHCNGVKHIKVKCVQYANEET